MPYGCIFQTYPDYLRVEVSGGWTPGKEGEDSVRVWGEVAETCKKEGKTRILAIWDVAGRLPPMDGYNLGANPERFGWDRRFKLATVHLHEERFQDGLFVETVALNRGFRVKMFEDEEKAKSWLLAS